MPTTVTRPASAVAANTAALGFFPTVGGTNFNTFGAPIQVSYLVGIISSPGQNGHWYFEVNSGNPNVWIKVDYLACRNEATNADEIGVGRGLGGIVPAGWFYRWSQTTIGGFATPTFVTDGLQPTVVVLA